MKQKIGWVIVAVMLGVLQTMDLSVVAAELENQQIVVSEARQPAMKLAQEVVIEGLYDNATLYVGADLRIKGAVDVQASQQEVVWQVTGNTGVIEFKDQGNEAVITGKAPGTTWVMARATDGSDHAREYTVKVEAYPLDTLSQSLIGNHITPILTRPYEWAGSVLRVAVSQKVTSTTGRVAALRTYIEKLAALGTVSYKGVSTDSYNEYHLIEVDGQKIEVRLSKGDTASEVLEEIISSSGSTHKQGDLETPSVPEKMQQDESLEVQGERESLEERADTLEEGLNEIEKSKPTGNPENAEEDKKWVVPIEEVTQGLEHIIILGGTGTSVDDPIRIGLAEGLTVQAKIAAMSNYLKTLQMNRSLSFIGKDETDTFTSYIFKVSERLPIAKARILPEPINDFYIEIRVDKEDEETYIPIIEMLHAIEQEGLMDMESKEVLSKQETIREEMKKGESESNNEDPEAKFNEVQGNQGHTNGMMVMICIVIIGGCLVKSIFLKRE